MAHFFAMGGFAAFVWPAYGVALAVLGGLVVAIVRRHRTATRELAAAERQSERRR
jgi:heme exporter protein D